ncbi:hypothetical protein JCM11251_007930 [Rhodosporidiobolus azoricus]
MTLRKLSNSVYYAEPAAAAINAAASSATSGAGTKAPELILLSSWMDAQLKHTQKYVDAYRSMYPSSAILLIRSNQRDFYSLGNRLAKSLSPAVDLLRAHAKTGDAAKGTAGTKSKILVHVFSNGGSLTLKELNELLRQPSSSAKSVSADGQSLLGEQKKALEGIPARAIVFDSCPGHSTLRLTLRAFTAPIKSPWVQYPAMVFFTLFYGLTNLYDFLLRRPPTLVRLSTYLNSPLFPTIPRLYIYSPTDQLVPSTDVEAHASQAQQNGVKVTMEKFEATSHVAHVRGGADRYWGAVRRLWEESGEEAAARAK